MGAGIRSEVAEVLRSAVITGQQLVLTGTLDRKMYSQVNEALERVGGKWNRKAQAHVFESDPKALIDSLLDGGHLPAKNPDAFFETPDDVIAKMIEAASPILVGMNILEPSAGRGAIVRMLRNSYPSVRDVDIYEIDPARAQQAAAEGGLHLGYDFLTISPDVGRQYDRILMNPPFAIDGAPQVYIDHILQAIRLLAPGGILVAIAPPGFTHRSDKKAVEFRSFLNDHGAEVETLPANAFKSSGTSVNTVMITFSKEQSNVSETTTTLVDPPPTDPFSPSTDYATSRNADDGLAAVSVIVDLPLDDIVVAPYQPRNIFDEVELQGLAASIEQHGQLEAISVRPHPTEVSKYELIAGERRVRALRIINRTTARAEISNVTDRDAELRALISNLQRSNLNAMEEARAFAKMETNWRMTQEDIAKQVGLDQTTISARLALLKLPIIVQTFISAGTLSASHGVSLRSAPSAEITELAIKASEDQWSVARLRDEIKAVNSIAAEEEAAAAPPLIAAADVSAPAAFVDPGPSPDPSAVDLSECEHGLPNGECEECSPDTAEAEPVDRINREIIGGRERIPSAEDAPDPPDASPVATVSPLTAEGDPTPASIPAAPSTPSAAASPKPADALTADQKMLLDAVKAAGIKNAAELKAKLDRPVAPKLPDGWTSVPVKVADYETLAGKGLWPLDKIVDAVDSPLDAPSGVQLHASVSLPALVAVNRTTEFLTEPETVILEELYPDRAEVTGEMLISVMCVRRLRGVLQASQSLSS